MPQYRSCIVGVALFNVLIAATLITALVVRYQVYKDIEHQDMPSDLRVADRKVKTIFCKEHEVSANLEDQENTGQISNTRNVFDVYVSDDNPEANISKHRTYYELPGTTTVAPGATIHHGFRILKGTSITLDVCNQYDNGPNPGLTLFFIRGYKNLTRMRDRLDDDSTCPSSLCESTAYINTTQGHCSVEMKNFTSLSFNFSETAAYYFLYYYGKGNGNGFSGVLHLQRLRTVYKLNRTRFASPGHLKHTHVQTATVPNRQYVVMDFRYFGNDTENELTNIIITFKCVPNVIMYVSFFFFIPLVLAALLGCFVVRCAHRADDEYRPLHASVQDYRSAVER